MTLSADSNNPNGGRSDVETYIPGEKAPPPWLEGFYLAHPSLAIRRIELEVREPYMFRVTSLFELPSGGYPTNRGHFIALKAGFPNISNAQSEVRD